MTVRKRRAGDSFYPFGLQGSKKVKDFFIDEKIPVTERDKIPLVLDKEGNIIWVAGYRPDGRFKVEGDTEEILRIEIDYMGGD